MEKLQWTKRLNQEKVENIYLKHLGQPYKEYRQLWEKAGCNYLPDFPIHIDIEVIDACNLRCIYCFRNEDMQNRLGYKVNTGMEFPMKLYIKVLSEGQRHGLRAINLGFSGECLMRKDLCEMINLAYKYGVLDIRLITNGTLLTKDMVGDLLDSHATFIGISIDAGTPEKYIALKGIDYFNRLRSIVKYINQKKVDLKKDLPLIRVSYYHSEEDIGDKEKFLKEFQEYVDFIDFKELVNINNKRNENIRMDCRMPFQRLAVFANGDVSACCSIFFSKKLIIGNLYKMSLKEIWDSEEIQSIRRGLIKEDPVAICKECLGSVSSSL